MWSANFAKPIWKYYNQCLGYLRMVVCVTQEFVLRQLELRRPRTLDVLFRGFTEQHRALDRFTPFRGIVRIRASCLVSSTDERVFLAWQLFPDFRQSGGGL